MVETMHTARVRVVNGSANSEPNSYRSDTVRAKIDRERKVGRAGTIRAVVVVVETPVGTIAAATRAPNLLCRQIAAQYGSATLYDITTPKAGGHNAEQLIAKARRMLHVRGGLEQPVPVRAGAMVRALLLARTLDAAARAAAQKRRAVRRACQALVRSALCWNA